jgi:tetratricopeptide (TPR) repeat protein
MAGIRTVNLLWERRWRGAYPVAGFALRDDGALKVAVPRPLEPRAYDVTRMAPDGGVEVVAGFAVETLLKLEVTSAGNNCIGMTADDIYLFRAGEKSRFLGERHVLFIDVALSDDGQRVATVFSDRAGASFVLALGDIEGRVAWLRDIDMPLTVVAIARAGNRIAVGMEAGLIQLFDASRRDVWEFGQPEPIRALACSEDGVYVAYGTALGGVGVVDGHGSRLYEARLPGAVRALALSGDGKRCAALCTPEGDPNSMRLYCLEETGDIGWEYEAEGWLVGLSLSANGRFLATGMRNGTLAVYELIPGERAMAAGAAKALAGAAGRAEALIGTGDLHGACAVLESALKTDPGAVALYEQLAALREQMKRQLLNQAQNDISQGQVANAVAALERAREASPRDPDIVKALMGARRSWSEQLLAAALALPVEDPAVETTLIAAVEADPSLVTARRELGMLRARRVQRADEEAAALLASGQFGAAIGAWERAQSLAPTEERDRQLERAYTTLEYEAGMAAYNDKRYQEAVFQFKKALQRDPGHAEARRYLTFAQRFAQDAANDSLSDRFSRLE